MNLKLFFKVALLFSCLGAAMPSIATGEPVTIPEQTRRELIEARDAAWHAFFERDPAAAIEKALGADLIAIQESEKEWEDRAHLIEIAKGLQRKGVSLLRLEFPRTEIQLFGDTAILYYTYVFETGINGKSTGVDAGRGTEIFVRRDGRWTDVGWHLDNGPFYMKDGHWVKNGDHPSPTTPKDTNSTKPTQVRESLIESVST